MEIKKAFDQFKKELAKETGIKGGFTMSGKQIENRTATYLICNLIPYEEEIKYQNDSCERISKYTSWTDAEKERYIANAKAWVAMWESERAKHGTKENYARVTVERIVNSKAFQNFSNTMGGVRYYTETKNASGLMVKYLRFNY